MPNRNISLTDHFDGFVERSIRAGRFANASEVVQEREEEARRAALKAAATEGFDALERGDHVLLDSEQALRRKLREVGWAARAGIASTAE
jgi:antitoxin ParD1/3/4